MGFSDVMRKQLALAISQVSTHTSSWFAQVSNGPVALDLVNGMVQKEQNNSRVKRWKFENKILFFPVDSGPNSAPFV